jgi:hypothetical protein
VANTIRIKRSTGSVGPAALANAELAFAEGSGALYVGVGTGGAGGTATTIPQIGGTAPFASTAPNRVWASPGSGSTAAQATFRALVAADLPAHSHAIGDVNGLSAELLNLASKSFDNEFAGEQEFVAAVVFRGSVTLGSQASAVTPATANNSTAVATTAYVKAQGYTANAGTVTSVGLSLPNIFSVSPASVTSSGTITASFVSQSAKTFFAAPSGAAGVPGFRLLAATDLPTHTHTTGEITGIAALFSDVAYLSGDNTFYGTVNTFSSPVNFSGATSLGASATATTPATADNSTKVATTAFVKNQAYLAAAGGTVSGNLTVTGTLTVNGGTTTINSTTLSVDDKNIELGSTASPTDATADGGGITLKGTTDKTLNWVDATDSWTSNQHFNLLTGYSYKINGTNVLSATALGSGVTSSSLTSVGTITSGTWSGTVIAVAKGGTGATDAAGARTNLGLVIGTNVQAYDAELAAIAGLASAADRLPYFTGSGTAALATFTAFGRSLADDADAAAGRTTLGLGTIATQAANNVAITGGSIDNITIDGGTW